MKGPWRFLTVGILGIISILFTMPTVDAAGMDTWHKPDFHYRLPYAIANFDPARSPGSSVSLSIDLSALFPGTPTKAFAVVNQNGADLPFYVSQWSPSHKKVTLWVALDENSRQIYVYTGKEGIPAPADSGNLDQAFIHHDVFPQAGDLRALPGPTGSFSMKRAPWIEGWVIPLPDMKIGQSLFIDRNTIIAAEFDSGKILKTTDRGRTWTDMHTFEKKNPTKPLVNRLLRKDRNNYLYVSFDGNDALYQSKDLGKTWHESLTIGDLPHGGRLCDSGGIRSIRSLTELSNGDLLAGVYSQDPDNPPRPCSYFYRSQDRGGSWVLEDIDSAIYVQAINNWGRHVHFVAADPYHPGRVYASMGDGARASKTIRSDDQGRTWTYLKNFADTVVHSLNPDGQFPASYTGSGFRPSYWQPTTVQFTDRCRLFGGDLEYDPVIHRSCEENESRYQVVFRPENQSGYYYGSRGDRQKNYFFGFYANPRNNITAQDLVENSMIQDNAKRAADLALKDRRETTDSFIAATAGGIPASTPGASLNAGDLWQIVSFVGKYPKGADRMGVFGMSNFVDDIALVATAEGKPFLLEIDPNTVHDYLDVNPNAKVAYDFHLPDVPSTGILVIEFDLALNGALPADIFASAERNRRDLIPLPYLVDSKSSKILGALVVKGMNVVGGEKKDDGYVVFENGRGAKAETSYTLFRNTWHRFQFQLDLDRHEARICFPGHPQGCSSPLSIPADFDLQSLMIESPAQIHTLLKKIRVYRHVEHQTAQYIQPNVIGYYDGKFGSVSKEECYIVGWACDRNQLNTPLDILVRIDGIDATTIQGANILRTGTRSATLCNDNGNHGYLYHLPERYLDGTPHRVETFALVDGFPYPIQRPPWAQNATLTCPR